MRPEQRASITDSLVDLALALGDSGSITVPDLIRALEQAADRLRTRSAPGERPHDLVSQAEAARAVGVSRQAVNQWVRSGQVRTWMNAAGGRTVPEVSLTEVAITANRRSLEVPPFSGPRLRELLDFLAALQQHATEGLATAIREAVEEGPPSAGAAEQIRVLQEFVTAAMGEPHREFTDEGAALLAALPPRVRVDPTTELGAYLDSLGLLVHSSDGAAGFDSPAAALLALLGMATVGGQYRGADARIGRMVALTAEDVWSHEWASRLYDAVVHLGVWQAPPLTRYTASLTHLDTRRFLRRAQHGGVTIAYSRDPGPVLPLTFYGRHIARDVLAGERDMSADWAWLERRGARERPVDLSGDDSPFGVFSYEYGLLDASIPGIRRYCYCASDTRRALRELRDTLPAARRTAFVDTAVATLARTLEQPFIELSEVPRRADFGWWKDHVVRSSQQEIVIGLHDERVRAAAHAVLVQTSALPDVVEAAGDAVLRERLRIYVKNLEFDVVEAGYRDDVRREVTRVIKPGGQALSSAEALDLAEAEIQALLA